LCFRSGLRRVVVVVVVVVCLQFGAETQQSKVAPSSAASRPIQSSREQVDVRDKHTSRWRGAVLFLPSPSLFLSPLHLLPFLFPFLYPLPSLSSLFLPLPLLSTFPSFPLLPFALHISFPSLCPLPPLSSPLLSSPLLPFALYLSFPFLPEVSPVSSREGGVRSSWTWWRGCRSSSAPT